MALAVKNLLGYIMAAGLIVVLAFVAGYVLHGLWLVFLVGWDALA